MRIQFNIIALSLPYVLVIAYQIVHQKRLPGIKVQLNMDSRILGSPAISGGKLFIGSMNFFFYCIGDKEEG